MRYLILVLACALAMVFYFLPVVFKKYEMSFHILNASLASAWVWAVVMKVVDERAAKRS